MNYAGLASQAGTTSANIQKSIRTGEATPGLASTVETTSANLTAFVNGKASPGIAFSLGTTTTNAQLLRDEIGREGAIGLIIGLACGIGKKKS